MRNTDIPIGAELLYKGSVYEVKAGNPTCAGCSFIDVENGCLNNDLPCTQPARIFVKKPDDAKKVYGADKKITGEILIVVGIIAGFLLSVVLFNLIG